MSAAADPGEPVNFSEKKNEKEADAHDVQSVEDFKNSLYKMQSARKSIASSLLAGSKLDTAQTKAIDITLLEMNDERTIGEMRRIATKGATFSINICDELCGLKKDVEFLRRFTKSTAGESTLEKLVAVDLPAILAPFHRLGQDAFYEEMANCQSFLNDYVRSSAATGIKPLFVTDWDGTMKDYCSQYATNVQPIYSAVVMGMFASLFTRVSAVLTAGPLRGPGILDLTALPIDGPVFFSGSWGREWWLGGRRVVHDECIPEEGIVAIGELYEQMSELFNEGEFVQFELVGSGVQKKVDRLTLGVQTVFGHVPTELSNRYIDAVKERIHRVDPNNQFLILEKSSPLEIEICVHSSGSIWNKGDGVESLFVSLGDSLTSGRVLVAGDTPSDLPMLQRAAEQNPEGVMALFVGANESLREFVRSTVADESRVCFVSSPDVVHAAFTQVIAESFPHVNT